MLTPRQVIFTATEGALVDSGTRSPNLASDALAEIARRRVPLVLSTHGTRAQLEPLRRKIEHGHPFISESGGGAFLPDGYFSLLLEGATRVARYFCAAFGRPYSAATQALAEIAAEADASVVGYGDMSAREIAQNTGEPLRNAELDRQREFSERFFFAGETEEAAQRFTEAARKHKWDVIEGRPFYELRSGNDQGRAVRYLMRLYRTSNPYKITSVGIGSTAQDLPLLSAVDHAIVLPLPNKEFDETLTSHLPHAITGEAHGPAGWNECVLKLLETPVNR